MSRWFRFYSDAMRNPKVLRLSDKDFRMWIGLMAIASESDGAIPADDDLKLVLGMRLDHLKGGLDRLISGGLIDVIEDGYEPHNWSKFQYKSDTSNERVAKHRAKRNVTVTPPDTDTDTEKSDANASQRARRASVDLPEWIPIEQWKGWVSSRKVKPSPHAVKLAIAKLEKLRRAGHDPGLVLDQSALPGWPGLYELKENRNGRRSDTLRGTRPDPALDMLRRATAEMDAADPWGSGAGLGRTDRLALPSH